VLDFAVQRRELRELLVLRVEGNAALGHRLLQVLDRSNKRLNGAH
jgi:hypothetical protein